MIVEEGSGTGSGGISVPSDQVFGTTGERDAYFTANPALLVEGAECVVLTNPPEGLYQRFDGATWEDRSSVVIGPPGEKGDKGDQGDYVDGASFSGDDIVFTDTGGRSFPLTDAVNVLRGPKGDDAPHLISEYSIDAGGPWVDQATYDANPGQYSFRKDSVDGGATFGQGYQFKSSRAELPAGWRWVSDGIGGLQMQGPDGDILWSVSVNGVVSSRFQILDSVLKFGSTKTLHDLGENVGFVNAATGENFSPVWQSGSGEWQATVRKKGQDQIRYNGDPFINADLANTVEFELPLTVTFSRRSRAFYVNSVSAYPNCTLLILQGGAVKMKLEGYNLLVGEHRYAFADSVDQHPWIDFIQGQSYTIQLLDENGQKVTCYAQDGSPSLPWFALDTTEFEDVPVLDSTMAGEGISFDVVNKVINLQVGSTDQVGGYKVGTGLAVDAGGRLYSTVSGAIIENVPDLVARNALPQIAQSYTCNVISENRIYYLNANLDPSVDSNWQLGPTTEASVTGFKGKGDSDPRTGVIEATRGDYTNQEITYTDETTGVKRILVIDDGVVYAEEV